MTSRLPTASRGIKKPSLDFRTVNREIEKEPDSTQNITVEPRKPSEQRKMQEPLEDKRTVDRRNLDAPYASLSSRNISFEPTQAEQEELERLKKEHDENPVTGTDVASEQIRRENARIVGGQQSQPQQLLKAGAGVRISGNEISLDTGSLSGVQYETPEDGDTVTVDENILILNGKEAIEKLTIVVPRDGRNGQRITITSSQDVGTLTVDGKFANGSSPSAGISAGTPLRWVYSQNAGMWFAV